MDERFSETDRPLRAAALAWARQAAAEGETPVGAVLSDAEGRILAGAGNACIRLRDPSAHAEMRVIRAAAALLGNYRVPGCRLHVTLEPCVMCAGVCIHARRAEIVYGTEDPKTGALRSCYRIGSDGLLNHRPLVRGGLMAVESADLLRAFFQERRAIKKRARLRGTD